MVVSFVLEVYYMVRYVDDGLLSLKLEQDLEHVETPEDGRLSYLKRLLKMEGFRISLVIRF